jgi:hypothetical protein
LAPIGGFLSLLGLYSHSRAKQADQVITVKQLTDILVPGSNKYVQVQGILELETNNPQTSISNESFSKTFVITDPIDHQHTATVYPAGASFTPTQAPSAKRNENLQVQDHTPLFILGEAYRNQWGAISIKNPSINTNARQALPYEIGTSKNWGYAIVRNTGRNLVIVGFIMCFTGLGLSLAEQFIPFRREWTVASYTIEKKTYTAWCCTCTVYALQHRSGRFVRIDEGLELLRARNFISANESPAEVSINSKGSTKMVFLQSRQKSVIRPILQAISFAGSVLAFCCLTQVLYSNFDQTTTNAKV